MKLLHFHQLLSTNLKAKELIQQIDKEWVIVSTDVQTGGYGKDKRVWYGPKGGLYFSVIIPDLQISDLQSLTLGAGIAINKVLCSCFRSFPTSLMTSK